MLVAGGTAPGVGDFVPPATAPDADSEVMLREGRSGGAGDAEPQAFRTLASNSAPAARPHCTNGTPVEEDVGHGAGVPQRSIRFRLDWGIRSYPRRACLPREPQVA